VKEEEGDPLGRRRWACAVCCCPPTLSVSREVKEDDAMIPDLQRTLDELQRKLDQLRVYL
jgi:hypothetical protein